MKPLFQIEIPKRAHQCAHGKETLAPGTEYYSILVENDEAYQRLDYCPACWESIIKEETLKNARTHWKAKVTDKKDKVISTLNRDERVLELLRESLTKDTDEDRAEAFVLALYLARRRILLARQTMVQEDGSVVNIYEIGSTEEMLCIKRIKLSNLQTEKIQLEIAKRLKS